MYNYIQRESWILASCQILYIKTESLPDPGNKKSFLNLLMMFLCGRYLVAERDILPGELLAVEQSHVALLGHPHLRYIYIGCSALLEKYWRGVAYIWDSVQRKKYCFRFLKNVKDDILCSNENVFFHLHDDNILQSTSITAQFILLLTFIGNRRQRAHESYQTTTTTYYGYLTIFDIIFCGVISRQRNCCRKRPFRLFLMKLLNYNCINPLCFAKEHKKQ